MQCNTLLTAILRCAHIENNKIVKVILLAIELYITCSPSTLRDIDEIESVQRKFTKRLPGLHNFSYTDRLERLQLQSLELRRLVTDLIWCYKIVLGMLI